MLKLNKARIALLIAFLLGLAVAQISTTLFHTETAYIKGTGPEDPLEAWSEASYIVWKYNSTHTAARNMSTLLVDWFDTNPVYVINNVTSSGLTSGRTWYETVCVKGSFTIDSQITIVSDYTCLDATQAYIKLVDSASSITMLYAEHLNHIKIEGGIFDGNRANQANNQKGLYFYNCTDVTVSGATVDGVQATGTDSGGLVFNGCRDSQVEKSVFKNNHHVGAKISGWTLYDIPSIRCYIKDSFFFDNADDSNHAAHALLYGYDDAWVVDSGITNCFANNSGNQGFQIYQYTNGCFIESCTVQYWDNAGIILGNSATIYNCRATENTIGPSTVGYGVECRGQSIISLNNIHDTTTGGIYLAWQGNGSTVTSNQLRGSMTYPIRVFSSDNIVTDNNIDVTSTSYGIIIDDYVSNPKPNNNTVSQNWMRVSAGHGIDMSNALNNHVFRNTIEKSAVNSITVDAGCAGNIIEHNLLDRTMSVSETDNLIRWNTGYITENSGSQVNSTATTWTIAHGLVSTPIFASFSFNATGWTSYKWSADGTNITVTITGTPETAAVLCYWDARTWN